MTLNSYYVINLVNNYTLIDNRKQQ